MKDAAGIFLRRKTPHLPAVPVQSASPGGTEQERAMGSSLLALGAIIILMVDVAAAIWLWRQRD